LDEHRGFHYYEKPKTSRCGNSTCNSENPPVPKLRSVNVGFIRTSEQRFLTNERKKMCLVYWQFPPLLVKNLRAFAALYVNKYPEINRIVVHPGFFEKNTVGVPRNLKLIHPRFFENPKDICSELNVRKVSSVNI